MVATNFARNNDTWFSKIMLSLIKPFSKNSAQGAQTSIYVATSPELEEMSGEYFSNSKVVTPTNQTQNMSDPHKLWQLSLEMLEFN